jgi:uncharacterized protein
MSEENVEIVRQAIETFNQGDVEGSFAGVFAPEFEYIPTGTIPGGEGAYRGPEGWRRFLEFWDEFDEPRIEIRDLIASGDHVVAAQTFRGRGKQSGVETNWDLWQVWTFRDGKVVHGQGFTNREAALEAAGLSE